MKHKKCKVRSRSKNLFDESSVTRNGSLIRKPLFEIMIKKGIKDLANGEQLLEALLMISVKKVKVINEVREENKVLHVRIIEQINQAR